jgi:predicted dehydrogenase/nucleoside-diphosphate-sugar epimerase
MKALVTGASGFLGGYVTDALVVGGHVVRVLVRNTSRTDRLEKLGVEIFRGDLKDAESLQRAVAGIETVINTAASVDAPAQEFEAATIQGTRALLQAAEAAGVRRFVHISSVGIYAVRPRRGTLQISEDSPLEEDPRFLSVYVKSKLESERAAVEFGRHGKMQVIILRPGILYGPGGKWTLPRMGYPLGRGRYILIGRGRNPLPVCYVENCAKAALLAAEKADLSDGVFNIVDDESFTAIEFLRRLKKEARPRLKIVRFPYLLAYGLATIGEALGRRLKLPCPVRTTHLTICRWRVRYSNERAKKLLGWRPEIRREEALARTMRFFAQGERVSRRADLALLRSSPPSLERPLTVCVIGCGAIAEAHLSILNRQDCVKLRGVCDSNPQVARRTAEKFMLLRSYTDPEEMLIKEKPQVVHILTPPQSHAALTDLATRHGCHVLVEKPMAVNAAEARLMAAAARDRGVTLCVDHNLLYEPVMVRARRFIEQREFGEIVWVESYYGFDLGSNPANRYLLPGGEKHWTFQLPGGMYQNLAPHPLSLALDVLGPPDQVWAHARYGRVLPHALTDELRILLETPRAGGIAAVSVAASPRFLYLNIFGTKMALFVDLLNKWIIPQRAARGIPRPISRAMMNLRRGRAVLAGTFGGAIRVLQRSWSEYEGMELLIGEFYASLQEKRPPPVTAEEGLRVMEVMDDVWARLAPGAVGPASAERPSAR